MPNEIEDLDTSLKVRLVLSVVGMFASILIVGGMHTAAMFGVQFGWWLYSRMG